MTDREKPALKAFEAVNMLKSGKITLEELAQEYSLPSLSECLREYMGTRTYKETFGKAKISKSSLYRILNGKTEPSKKMILQLAYGLELDGPQTKILMACAGFPPGGDEDFVDAALRFYMKYRG